MLTYKCTPESVQQSREKVHFLQYRGNKEWEGCISLKECVTDSSEWPNNVANALADKHGTFLLVEIIVICNSLYTSVQQLLRCSLPNSKVFSICSLCLICGDWFPQ